ncbi:MepB family protein, partial [Psychrobacter cibarius]
SCGCVSYIKSLCYFCKRSNILQSHFTKGKMGIRVYPSWDKPTSNTAKKTQNWQLDYFFVVTGTNILPTEKIRALYE